MPDTTEPLHVIVATDGTEASLLAAHEISHLVPADSDLSLIMVIEALHDPEEDAGGIEGPVMTGKEAEQQHREEVVAAEAALARTAQAFGARPIRQRIVERSGGPVGACICDLAAEEHAAMIVVGSHGHRALTDVLLGSVSSYITHHSPCPVLIVRTTS